MRRLLLATLAGLALAGAAQARPINDAGMTVEEVSAWVKSTGLEPKIEKTDDGQSYVSTKTSQGVNLVIDLYDCQAGRCGALLFSASFDVEKPLAAAQANDWNSKRRFVRMSVNNEGDPAFQYDANVAPGGTYEALDVDLDVFLQLVPLMLKHIGWAE